MRIFFILAVALISTSFSLLLAAEPQQSNHQLVANTDGLIAFWDFDHKKDKVWTSYFDAKVSNRPFPLHLKRIGDAGIYSTATWPYQDDDSKLMFDATGPFGKAVRFNTGHIYGSVKRADFDASLLDLDGKNPFTMIAWVKFIGKRHMVAGIWDEGGWDRYAGRRQVALFAGLFGQKSVISHVSATGAASFPQSSASGSQYARYRAIDGMPFENDQWIAMATSYDPAKGIVIAYLNGVMTPFELSDPVAKDVYQYKSAQAANPFSFSLPIYSPRALVIKYNGYNLKQKGIREHLLQVDVAGGKLTYLQDNPNKVESPAFRLFFDVKRQGESILINPIKMKGVHGQQAVMPSGKRVMVNDEIWTSLEMMQDGVWTQVGTVVKRQVLKGAPFTFGRALGLGKGNLEHGSQLYLDGVAVFNRVLDGAELKELSFPIKKIVE